MAFGGGTDEEQKMRALLGQRLSAYVPEAVLRWHAEAVDAHASERAYEPGNSERFEAAVGFFDISGFSKLSHAVHLKERADEERCAARPSGPMRAPPAVRRSGG